MCGTCGETGPVDKCMESADRRVKLVDGCVEPANENVEHGDRQRKPANE